MDGDFKRRRSYADMVTSRHRQSASPLVDNRSAETTPANGATSKSNNHYKKMLSIGLAVVLLIAVSVSLVYLLVAPKKVQNPLDQYARLSSFSLYYPSRLPEDYKLANNSVSSSKDLLSYQLKSTSGKPTITITQQAMPANFDASKLVGKDASTVRAKPGTLYNIGAGEQSKYMLTTSKTLMFFSANPKVNDEIVNSLADSLQAVR